MKTQTTYIYLEQRPDKQTQELFIRGTGVRASTIWHDRYISCMTPQQIAQSREIPEKAVLEALAYCQDHWEVICAEKHAERVWLEEQGFLPNPLHLSHETLPLQNTFHNLNMWREPSRR